MPPSRLPVLLLCGLSSPLWANPDVTSREYKLMLDASQFSYSSESSNVGSLISAAETAIEAAISRDVYGAISLDHVRDVRFFDTEDSCELAAIGYSFRDRVESGDSEVTLKFRSPDRYISDFEDLDSSTSGAETKLEADISAVGPDQFRVVYGHSTKAPNTRTINEFADIHAHFPGFEDDYGFDDNDALDVVGGLTIREHVYKNVMIDLGSIDAEISVTLWYGSVPSGGQQPVIAELSFKYEDSSADYTKKVVNRAKTAFEALQTLSSWVDTGSATKTAFVYAYDPGFCN